MLKKNKWNIILSNLIILLPMVAGLIFWDQIAPKVPDQGKFFFVVGIPLLMLALQWLCILFTCFDKKNKDQNPKIIGLMMWLVPMINCFCLGTLYVGLSGDAGNIAGVTFMLMGIMFVIIGNFMPKCKQNSTMGIKLKWTLESEENWNATHRVAGKVWTIGGLLFMLLVFLPVKYLVAGLIAPLAVMVLIPTIYSYCYYKKQQAEAENDIAPYKMPKSLNKVKWGSLVTVGLVLVFCVVIMFVGKFNVTCGEENITIEADFAQDLTVEYADVEAIEYRPEGTPGVRIYGFGTPKLNMGYYENEEFGTYTRYTCGTNSGCVVLWTEDGVIVISGNDAAETKAIYDTLVGKGVGQ